MIVNLLVKQLEPDRSLMKFRKIQYAAFKKQIQYLRNKFRKGVRICQFTQHSLSPTHR